MAKADTTAGKTAQQTQQQTQQQKRENGQRARTPGVYGREEIAENQLEPWPNPRIERDYVIHFEIPEFTCLCPRSGYPDFAT
ncbi:MAG TPA: hypothetical protein VFS83_10710, partial [Ktedonobacterales bacterium]|nr:hypothetical protein [Ktedonobacterales bacterium]